MFLKDNIIVQSDLDGGDSLQREAMWGIGRTLAPGKAEELFAEDMDRKAAFVKCEVSPGIWVRHPDKSKWYSNPGNCSRDQLLPTMMYLGMIGQRGALSDLTKAIIRRGFFAQNTLRNWDNSGPKTPDTFLPYIGQMIRAHKLYLLYPIVMLFDLFLLLGALWDVRPTRPMHETDDVNGVLLHVQASEVMPTPISWLARVIYFKFRAKNDGNRVSLARWGREITHPVLGALSYYFDTRHGANREFYDLYEHLLEKKGWTK